MNKNPWKFFLLCLGKKVFTCTIFSCFFLFLLFSCLCYSIVISYSCTSHYSTTFSCFYACNLFNCFFLLLCLCIQLSSLALMLASFVLLFFACCIVAFVHHVVLLTYFAFTFYIVLMFCISLVVFPTFSFVFCVSLILFPSPLLQVRECGGEGVRNCCNKFFFFNLHFFH